MSTVAQLAGNVFLEGGKSIIPSASRVLCLSVVALGEKFGAMRLFPRQSSIDNAFKWTVAIDIAAWLTISLAFCNTVIEERFLSFFGLSGPLHLPLIFFPQQALFLLALSFRRDISFLTTFYAMCGLALLVATNTHYEWMVSPTHANTSIAIIANDWGSNVSESASGSGEGTLWIYSDRYTCDEGSMSAKAVLFPAILLFIMAAWNRLDKLSLLLLLWSSIGVSNYRNCTNDLPNTGVMKLIAQIGGFFIMKLSSVPTETLRSSNQRSNFALPKCADDVKNISIVVDGFIGPDAVICGISRSYEAWIHELVRQKRNVTLYTAFSAASIEEYFAENGTKLKAYELDTVEMCYVTQTYHATRTNYTNIRLISKNFLREQPDVVHVIFDGSSVPIFSWACAHMQIPIVGIIHTDLSVIVERNGLKLVGDLTVSGQKLVGYTLDSVATRSRSFALRMVQMHQWKCDHVIKPHVKTDVFMPVDDYRTKRLRNTLMFGEHNNVNSNMLLVYAGRLDLDKRVDEIIKLVERVDGVYIALVGHGVMGEDLKQLHGEKRRIYCKPGFVTHEELALYYSCCDLHISASQMETLGNTVLESLACGTPVITPRAQGFVDSIEHGVNGLMWEPSEDLSDAVRLLKLLRDDKYLRKTLEKGACDSIKNLHVSKTVSDLLEWYADASISRQTKTFSIIRLMLCSFVLLLMTMFDFLCIPIAKRLLERFSDKSERKKFNK
eukprot:g4001.t1